MNAGSSALKDVVASNSVDNKEFTGARSIVATGEGKASAEYWRRQLIVKQINARAAN